MAINTLIKILRLIPDNWEEIKQQSRIYQQKLNEDKGYLGEKRAALHAGVEHVFEQLHFDYPVLKNKVVATTFYQKFANVFIDFPELFNLPEGFDQDNMAHIQTLVEDKITLLRQQLPDLGFDLDNPAFFSQLQQLIVIILDIPDEFDFGDHRALQQLKTNSLGKAKPVINELLQIVLKRDDSEFASQMETGMEKIVELGDIIVGDNQTAAADEQSAAPLAGIKQKIPQLAATFSDVSLPEIDVNKVSDNATDLLTLIESKLPLIEQQSTAQEGEERDVAADVDQLKGLLKHGADIIKHPALASMFNGSLDQVDLATIVDFNGNTPEQLLTEFKSCLVVADDLDLTDAQQLSGLIKTKLSQLLEIIGKVSIKGLDSDALIAKVNAFSEKLFALPADASIDGILDIVSTLADKFIEFYQANASPLATSNKWLEQVQKLQVLYKFIRLEGLDISLIDKIAQHQQAPPTVDVTRQAISPAEQFVLPQSGVADDPYQAFVTKQTTMLAAVTAQVAQPDSNSTVANSTVANSTAANSTTANSSTANSTAANDATNNATNNNADDAGTNSDQSNSTSTSTVQQMLTTLLTDAGVLDKLSPEQKSYAEHLIAGTLQQKLMDGLKQAFLAQPQVDAFIQRMQSRVQDLTTLFKQGEPTLAAIFEIIFDGFKDCITSFLATVTAILLNVIDMLYRLLLIFAAILDYLEIPAGIIKAFFSASLADVNDWIDSAKAA